MSMTIQNTGLKVISLAVIATIISSAVLASGIDPSNINGDGIDEATGFKGCKNVTRSTEITGAYNVADVSESTHPYVDDSGFYAGTSGSPYEVGSSQYDFGQYPIYRTVIELNGDLRVTVDAGTWKATNLPTEGEKSFGGSWLVIAKKDKTVDFIPETTDEFSESNPLVVWSSSQATAGDHSYTIPDSVFDGYYVTNPGIDGYDQLYLHLYMFFTGPIVNINDKARRVMVVDLRFKDEATVESGQQFFLEKVNPTGGNDSSNYRWVSGEIELNGKFHSVLFEGINVAGGFEIRTLDGETVHRDWTSLQSNEFQFDDGDPSRDLSNVADGCDSVFLRTMGMTVGKMASHFSEGHLFSFTIQEPQGTACKIIPGTVIDLGLMTDGDFDFTGPRTGNFGGEGFGRTGIEAGLEAGSIGAIVSGIDAAYDVTTTGASISYKISTGGIVIPVATFSRTRNAPFQSTITLTRKPVSVGDLTILDFISSSPEKSGDTITVTWNNFRALVPVKNGIGSTSFANKNELNYKIESIDGLPVQGSTDSFKEFRAWDYMESPVLTVNFDASGSGLTFFTFRLTIAYGTGDYKWDASGSLIGSPTVKEFPQFFFDENAVNPSGSFGPVFFDSDDLDETNNEIKDHDGSFFIVTGVSGWSNVNGYKVSGYRVPFGSAYIDPGEIESGNVIYVNETGNVLTVAASQVFSVFLLDEGLSALPTGRYQFTIAPYYWENGSASPRVYNDVYGDEPSEKANGSIELYVTIQVINLQNPSMKASLDGIDSIAGNTFTTEHGAIHVKVSNYDANARFLSSSGGLVLEQRFGGIKRHDMVGFDDTYTGSFRLYDDPSLYNTRIYGTGTVPNRFLTLEGGDGGTPIYLESFGSNIRGMIDGTYKYRALFNYASFGTTVSLNDLTINVQSGRQLTVNNEPSTVTSYSGRFTLDWDELVDDPADRIENGKIFYIVLFGKNSEGISPSSFTGDLASLPSNVYILQQNSTDQFGSEAWNERIFDASETTVAVDDGFGANGQSEFDIPVGSSETFYFAVLPFYRVLVNSDPNFQWFWWYHGDLSNIVEVVVDRQAFTTLDMQPSIVEGGNRVVYSQSDVTFEAFGLTGGSATSDGANITITLYTDGTRNFETASYFSQMTDMGGGRFEVTANVFDIGVDRPSKYASILVEYDYTSAGYGTGILLENRQVLFKTGILASIEFISPGQGGILAPGTSTEGNVSFGINVFTDPEAAEAFGLPQFTVEPGDITIMSAVIAGQGDISGYGTVTPIPGTLNWRITINNLLDIRAGTVNIDLMASVNNGFINIVIPTRLTFYVRHDPSTVVFSHDVQRNGLVSIQGYNAINLQWLSFFGSNLEPDSVFVDVKKNSQPFFSGQVDKFTFYYNYTVYPLDHDTGDVFAVSITSLLGDEGASRFSFSVDLDFEVTIQVDLGTFEYNSSGVTVNEEVEAYMPVEYPVSYDLFYLETNQVIFNPENYILVRDLGNGTIIQFIPVDMGTSTQLVFDMEGRPATQGNVDNLVFDVNTPTTNKEGFEFPEENKGTLYVENVTITSVYRFTNVEVIIDPSASFEFRTDEVWNVTVDGTQITFTITPERYISFIIDVINPGQVVNVTIIHYYENELVIPEEPEPSLFEQIIAFIMAILSAILAFFGLALIYRKRTMARKGTDIHGDKTPIMQP